MCYSKNSNFKHDLPQVPYPWEVCRVFHERCPLLHTSEPHQIPAKPKVGKSLGEKMRVERISLSLSLSVSLYLIYTNLAQAQTQPLPQQGIIIIQLVQAYRDQIWFHRGFLTHFVVVYNHGEDEYGLGSKFRLQGRGGGFGIIICKW